MFARLDTLYPYQECIIEESIALAYHPCAKFSGGQARACILTPTKGRELLPGMTYSAYTECDTLLSLSLLCTLVRTNTHVLSWSKYIHVVTVTIIIIKKKQNIIQMEGIKNFTTKESYYFRLAPIIMPN